MRLLQNESDIIYWGGRGILYQIKIFYSGTQAGEIFQTLLYLLKVNRSFKITSMSFTRIDSCYPRFKQCLLAGATVPSLLHYLVMTHIIWLVQE